MLGGKQIKCFPPCLFIGFIVEKKVRSKMRGEIRKRRLQIETDDAIYEIEFGQIQLEITGNCNMRCKHCRASNQVQRDMPLDQITKIIRFAQRYRSADRGELVLSGGEPLMHLDFCRILKEIRAIGEKYISLTTNGSLLTDRHIQLIKDLSFGCFAISISLDSVEPDIHDAFRKHRGAFAKAEKALRLVSTCREPSIVACMRSTILPSHLNRMEDFVRYARDNGCRRVGFSAVQPVGNAKQHPDMLMTRTQKKAFLSHVYQLREKYLDIDVSTTDPLKCLICPSEDGNKEDGVVFGGCGAAVTTFNVNADGVMTPCALLDIPMMNIFPLSIREITSNYRESLVVKSMVTMNFKGRCGKCSMKFRCGGCRARALAECGDYLGDDPHCWLRR